MTEEQEVNEPALDQEVAQNEDEPLKRKGSNPILTLLLGVFFVVRRVLKGFENWNTLDYVFVIGGIGLIIYAIYIFMNRGKK